MRITTHCFERLFGVPPDHRLELVRSRSRADVVVWEHDEHDAGDRLVARYETFEGVDPHTGSRGCGWRKYSPTGDLIEARNEGQEASAA
jgi:hypothetical protein